MGNISRVVIGESTETALKTLFDSRIAQESSEEALNLMSRTQEIRDLKNQVLSFIKRNPNSSFEVIVPEFKVGKVLTLKFTNFPELEDDEEVSEYTLEVNDSFDVCEITQKADLGKDIRLTLKANTK